MILTAASPLLASWIGDGISVISVIVAVIALIKSDGAQRQANASQKRIVEIEEGRESDRNSEAKQAILRPRIWRHGSGDYRLHIENQGKAEARNVNMLLADMPFLDHPAVPKGETLCTLIGPGTDVSYCLAIAFGCAPPFDLVLTWDDDSKTGNSYRTTLTL